MRKKRKPLSDINVVPYIDVMLVLLVVFMITAPVLTQGVFVELPNVEAKIVSVENDDPIIVSVQADGKYYLNLSASHKKNKTLKEISRNVAKVVKQRPETPVLVEGDASVPYGKVVEIMAALQKVGVTNVGLITDPTVK